MNTVQFDFLKDLLNDAMINARELRCRLDDQPEMIGLSDIVLSRIEQALYAIRSGKEQGKGNERFCIQTIDGGLSDNEALTTTGII